MKARSLGRAPEGKGRPDGVNEIFELDEPVHYGEDAEGAKLYSKYVWVSAVPFVGTGPYAEGPETYIFPSDEKGKPLDWLELSGSFKGAMDIDRAVKSMGYEVVR